MRPANPFAHTFSIVARDPFTGNFGVAVQSHWFSVGSVVPWAEAGVGAIATQAMAEISYGPLGLDLLRGGKSAGQALKALLEIDEGSELRQVAMVDAKSEVATHTGKRCIREAGHLIGEGFSVQANMMLKDTGMESHVRCLSNRTQKPRDRPFGTALVGIGSCSE